MKAFLPLLLLATATATAVAQSPRRSPEFQAVHITQTVTPDFPEDLYRVYRDGGEARVVISVDAQGRMDEWLFTGYTTPRFAELALTAMKEWKFEPARVQGEPIGVCLALTFDFQVKGVIISTMGTDAVDLRILSTLRKSEETSACTLRELDHVPAQIRTAAPRYPSALADQGLAGEVTVDFYIDESGAVRMPSVNGLPPRQLADFAIDAVRQWSFEPPTRAGRPVLVHVRQVFRFNPDVAANN